MSDPQNQLTEAIQRTLDGYTLTEEQDAIVEAVTQQNKSIKILAFAGAGKTSTLRAISTYSDKKNILYIAFNTAIAKEAKETFPRNTKCMTAHSLAFRNVLVSDLWQNKFKSAMNGSRVPFKVISEVCKLPRYEPKTRASEFQLSIFVGMVLNQYLQSADQKVSIEHVPSECVDWMGPVNSFIKKAFSDKLAKWADDLWMAMSDENNPCGITHDGYLKIYQLSKPVINSDLIMIDESQDINPVLHDIVSRQSFQTVYVGDNHQQIYSWRGAVNALTKVKLPEYHLTASFRFGRHVAMLANVCLHLKGERKRIRGLGEQGVKFNINEPYALLARTNSALFEKIIEAVKNRKRIHVVGNLENLLTLLEGAFHLWNNDPYKVKSPDLKIFKDWTEFLEYTDASEDPEFTRIKKLIDEYRHEIIDIVNMLRNYPNSAEHFADIVFSTIHKSKGREWDQIMLAEDVEFPEPENFDSEEMNLIYVALTRGKLSINLSPGMGPLLDILSDLKHKRPLRYVLEAEERKERQTEARGFSRQV